MVNEPRNLCPSCWVKDGDKELNVDDWRKYIESFLPFPIKKQLIRFEQAVRFDAYDRLMEIIIKQEKGRGMTMALSYFLYRKYLRVIL